MAPLLAGSVGEVVTETAGKVGTARGQVEFANSSATRGSMFRAKANEPPPSITPARAALKGDRRHDIPARVSAFAPGFAEDQHSLVTIPLSRKLHGAEQDL